MPYDVESLIIKSFLRVLLHIEPMNVYEDDFRFIVAVAYSMMFAHTSLWFGMFWLDLLLLK